MKTTALIRSFFTLGVIVGTIPNNIANGQTIDAVPVMADFNWIRNQVNANAAPIASPVFTGGITVPTSALGNVFSGTYTPTLSNTTNVAASTPRLTSFSEVGNFVIVAGQCDIDPTASGTNTVLYMSLPVATANFANAFQLGGAGVTDETGGNLGVQIYSLTGGQVAILQFNPSSAANQTVTFQFSYIKQ